MNFVKLMTNKKVLLSVAIGLAIAYLFFRACGDGNCLVIPQALRPEDKVHIDTDGSCYKFDRYDTVCQLDDAEDSTAWIPGASFHDPGYESGQGSLGAVYEGFLAGCLGRDVGPKEYPQKPFYQVACRDEPQWNLPRDARMFHQAKYPCGVPGQCGTPKCQRRHPMDSIYAPPNEGIDVNQVRN